MNPQPMYHTKDEFEAAFARFVLGVQAKIDGYLTKMGYNWSETISVQRGKKYARVVTSKHGQDQVYCFVDMTNGDVLKPDSWKRPAKHARGNIFDESNGLARCNHFGPAYLR